MFSQVNSEKKGEMNSSGDYAKYPTSKNSTSKYALATSTVSVHAQCQPNQRAGTDRHTEPGYLLTGSRPGHAAPDAGAAVLLLPLIKVAPECAVNALDAGAIYVRVRDSYIGYRCTN